MIQIDMEMPGCCVVCPLWNHEYGLCNFCGDKSRCYDEDGFIYDNFKEIYKECPLKEIKEVEPKTKLVANVTFNKEQLEEIVEKAKADILAQIERPQGEWVVDNWGMYHCNYCMKEKQQLFNNFCSNCGAQMLGGENNEKDIL